MNIVERALALAYCGHSGQFRKGNNLSGVKLPYICHPIDVANLLNRWNIQDENMIAAAFLHDVLEDTRITKDEIANDTNEIVAHYVSELTHDPAVAKQDYINSFPNKPVEIFLIKMADRIANIRDFQASSPDYADKYAMKAENLFRCFYKYNLKGKEIVDKYGINTYSQIDKNIPSCVANELNEEILALRELLDF
jgi:(p)ppGpp synthase/HD superfamily hydrolase